MFSYTNSAASRQSNCPTTLSARYIDEPISVVSTAENESEPPRVASLFDTPVPSAPSAAAGDEEEEALAEASDEEQFTDEDEAGEAA